MKQLFWTLLLLVAGIPGATAGLRILFIGDSITDGSWGGSDGSAMPSAERNHRDLNHIYGSGYMYLCAAHYQSRFPERGYLFFNRGISGDKLADLERRWEEDALALHPDVVSILIGTNDVQAYLDRPQGGEFDFGGWERCYRSLLDRMIGVNPRVRFVLCEPFASATTPVRESSDPARRASLMRRLGGIVERIAADYGAVFIPWASMFDRLSAAGRGVPDTWWIWDGIHPTPAGHRRMADLWIKRVDRSRLLRGVEE